MTADTTIPELKQILGSLIFAARHPLTSTDLRRNLLEVANDKGGHTKAFAKVKDSDIRGALDALKADLDSCAPGLHLAEVAGGFKFQSDEAAGPWVRHLLNADKPHRLSRPALETLAIIAYRQPVTRVEIEAVRGVNVDHVISVLMEVQLIRIVGRSKLPGRPMLYGTTKSFLEHFGLAAINQLPGIDELARIEKARTSAVAEQVALDVGEDADDVEDDDDDTDSEDSEE